MVKIKLSNWGKGRNEYTFRPFLIYYQKFFESGIQFVEDGDCDYEFIGMDDFINKKLPLKESIKYGIDSLSKKNNKYFLFDGSDSTSLMGAYEVFKESNAIYLFKPAITTKKQYQSPSAFNKWFFGSGSNLDLSYNISDEIYNKIKLTGWNLGYYNPSYLNPHLTTNIKDIDICATYTCNHPENYDHNVRNDIFYTHHRTQAWEILEKSNNIDFKIGKKSPQEYFNILSRSKCALSPYGMGEICFRDFEIIQNGSVLIKPDMSNVITYPNIYIPYETYIPCKLDYSDLMEKIEWVIDNPLECSRIIKNSQELIKKMYSPENLVLYWKNLLFSSSKT